MTDIVERMNNLAATQFRLGHASSAKITREAAAEITRLRSQLSLQKEKLPRPSITVRGRSIPIDWRNLPEAP